MKLAIPLIVLLVVCIPGSAKQDRSREADDFMQAKLRHTNEIMRGLALEDYDVIAENAQKLHLLSLESNWEVYQSLEYNRQSREFRAATDRLREAAHQKNLDGATLAYFETTLKCVGCHKHVRNVQ